MYTANHILLHLSLIPDVGPSAIHSLVQGLSNLQQVYHMLPSDFVGYGISEKQATKIVHGLRDHRLLEQELARVAQHGVNLVTSLDANYPAHLKEITGAPAVVYTQGAALTDNEKRLAVIGARKANEYGQKCIDTLVPVLIEQQWVIVSGGALGADSMAHQAAVAAGGKTIVVLGSGLGRWYPTSNKKLFNSIIDHGGTILSTFPVEMEALPGNFPARNRIISGLSRGCVVVQAATKSGASITAHYALDQGRDVFAVPGPFDDELSAGCHALIKQGAKIATTANDILEEYGESVAVAKVGSSNKQKSIYESPQQEAIVMACAYPASMDELLDATGLSLVQLNAQLFELQLAGILIQDFTGKWVQLR